MNYNIAKMVAYKMSFTCQICGKPKFDKMYEYQDYSYVPRYKPKHFKKVCGICTYKEAFGNEWKIKKKEGVLDENMQYL